MDKGQLKTNVVSLAKCTDYKNFEQSLEIALKPLGGMQAFVNVGDVVAIKPNCVRGMNPNLGATTHPESLRAVIRLVRRCGGTPVIVESPGGPNTKPFVKSIFKACGITAIAQQEQVEIVYDNEVIECELPDALVTKKVNVISALKKADKIINMAKPKPHGMQVYTGAVKNMFGAIIGTDKVGYHMTHSDYQNFADKVIDIFNAVKPDLNILDAVITMHKSGPTSGSPYNGDLILVSANAFELDRIALELIGVDCENVYIMKTAPKNGFLIDRSDVEIFLDGAHAQENIVKECRFEGYILPVVENERKGGFLLGTVLSLGKFLKVKPYFIKSKCKKCKICVQSCPAKCLTLKDGHDKPVVDLDKCIRCFCCEELCPETAVKIKKFF